MIQIGPVFFRAILLFVGVVLPGFWNFVLGDECSIAKTNKDCTLTIDRVNPLAPPTIQMYPGHTLTIVVKNAYYFERYFMDYSTGQIVPVPDVASSIATSMLPQLKNLTLAAHALAPAIAPQPGDTCSVNNIVANTPDSISKVTPALDSLYLGCLDTFASRARKIYLELEPVAAPDAHPQGSAIAVPVPKGLNAIATDIQDAYQREAALSKAISTAVGFDDPTRPQHYDAKMAVKVHNWAAAAALADTVAKDLFGFAARIQELLANPIQGFTSCGTGQTCVMLYPISDPPVNHAKMVTRQVTYNVDTFNLVQNAQEAIPDPSKKRTMAAVTVFYGDTRWEVSAGGMFSTLAVRSFAVNTTLTGSTINQKITYPAVVPFAAANIRIGDELDAPKWRSAFYWTFAAGINPNTTTADFGIGPSISWRGLMVSALWHLGHDVRLTNGLYTNQVLPAGYSGGAPTQTYWRLDRFAIGLSVRVPSLTGR